MPTREDLFNCLLEIVEVENIKYGENINYDHGNIIIEISLEVPMYSVKIKKVITQSSVSSFNNLDETVRIYFHEVNVELIFTHIRTDDRTASGIWDNFYAKVINYKTNVEITPEIKELFKKCNFSYFLIFDLLEGGHLCEYIESKIFS